MNGKELFGKISDGELAIISLLQNSELEVSRGIAMLIHIFDPPAVIVGVGIMEQEWLVRRIGNVPENFYWIVLNIRRSFQLSLGNKAGLIGAASLFHRNI